LSKKTIIHIHTGDYAAAVASRILPGKCLVWTDLLFNGPLPDAMPLDIVWITSRANVLAPFLGGEVIAKSLVTKLYSKLFSAVAEADEINLWFDSCMYDQMLLCELLTVLPDLMRTDIPVYLICEEKLPDDSFFSGYGQLEPVQIAAFLPRRIRLKPGDFASARDYWRIFRSPAPQAWLELANSKASIFQFVPAAAQRLLEQLPCSFTGLSRLEREIIEALLDGNSQLVPIFKAVSALKNAHILAIRSSGRQLTG